ncbi:Zinc finger BED domain-containing protein 6 [Triplophysa tibetana]|uniref:Zinc finger BED domain-containing protein 6 n=1 Tax=Triplophysa tibetana TaxID=1572043 RepID=A0A5A9NSW3_9TELE|nr:Zinc finger BED domain-containing protein 6 [Triplophysa tibetana]
MGKAPTFIYPNEWGLASYMLTVLSPFEEVTRALSKHSASISEVIPLLHGLCSIIRSLHAGEESEDESDQFMAGDDDQDATVGLGQDVAAESRERLGTAARKLEANLSKELKWRFKPIFANSTFLLSTLLDPRYKASCFPNNVDVEALKRTLLLRMELCDPVATPARNTEETPATSSTSVLSFLQKKKSAIPMRTHLPSGDVGAYLADGDISLTDNPAKYWSGKLQCWPNLTHFALQHLSCPPTSVQSERVFSTAGNVSPVGGGECFRDPVLTVEDVSPPHRGSACCCGEVFEGDMCPPHFLRRSEEAPAVRVAVQGAEESLQSLGRVAANNSAREAIRVRDSFMAHFSAEGAVPWQPTE